MWVVWWLFWLEINWSTVERERERERERGISDLMVFCDEGRRGGGEREVTNDVRGEGWVAVGREGGCKEKEEEKGSKY